MSVWVDENVFWFQVAIDNSFGVQKLNGQKCFHEIELGILFLHPSDSFEEIEEFPSTAELHSENNEFVGLKWEVQFCDKRISFTLLQNPFLVFDERLFCGAEDEVFVDHFDGNNDSIDTCEDYFGESSTANAFDHFHWFQGNLIIDFDCLRI